MGNLLGAPVTEKETESGSTADGVKFAVSSMQGWRVHMEDAHILEGNLYAVVASGAGTGTVCEPTTAGTTPPLAAAASTTSPVATTKLPLPGHALFAVFDGHGGSYAALYAGRNLCRILSNQAHFVQYAQLIAATSHNNNNNNDASKDTNATTATDQLQQQIQLLRTALTHAFVECDREIACALKGSKVPDADSPYHSTPHTKNHDDSKKNTAGAGAQQEPKNSQLLEDEGDSGTTACVILLTPQFVVCANAGDSRAILGTTTANTVPLSQDHKPDDMDEERRIRAAGGYVAGGRVEGDLAVSRGLGDFRFKSIPTVMKGNCTAANGSTTNSNNEKIMAPGEQKVSPIPDIYIHQRNAAKDAFAVIACDGIWDVQTNEHAAKLVADLFQEGENDLGLICEEVCDICLRLGSKDNMTVLTIQFPACSVGKGGGVTTRRQARESEHKTGL